MKKRAFTLVELLIVIATISILGTVILPALKKAKERVDAKKTTSTITTPAGIILEKPQKFVTDPTGVLPVDVQATLNERLAVLERDTSAQVLVYIAGALPDNETLEDFCNRTFKAWGVGQAGKNNGAVFFWFKGSRKIRLEVGYGLEGRIPDATAKGITSTAGSLFKTENYREGVERTVNSLEHLIRAEAGTTTSKTKAVSPTSTGVEAQRGFPFSTGSVSSSSLHSSSSSSLPTNLVMGDTVALVGTLVQTIPVGTASVAVTTPTPTRHHVTEVKATQVAEAPAQTINWMGWGLLGVVGIGIVFVFISIVNDITKLQQENRRLKELLETSNSRIDTLSTDLTQAERERNTVKAALAEILEPKWEEHPIGPGPFWFKAVPGYPASLITCIAKSKPTAVGYWAPVVQPQNEPVPVPIIVKKRSKSYTRGSNPARYTPAATSTSPPKTSQSNTRRDEASSSSWSSSSSNDSSSSSSSSVSRGGGDSGGGGASSDY